MTAPTKAAEEARVRGISAGVIVLCGTCLLGWAALVILAQCLTWLKTGVWQPVPLYAMFVSPAMQMFTVAILPPGTITPLALVPSLAGYDSLESAARSVAGSAEGVFRIVLWFLKGSLAGWLVVSGVASFFLAGYVVSREP